MMLGINDREGLFYSDDPRVDPSELLEQLHFMLQDCFELGVVGGYCEEGLPICFVNQMLASMLGYSTTDGFMGACKGRLSELINEKVFSGNAFASLCGACDLQLHGKNGEIWVRMSKRNFTSRSGEEMWLASVCNVDSLYNNRSMVGSKPSGEGACEASGNWDHMMEQLDTNNQVISAISKIYWLIYLLDLPSGTFKEVSSCDVLHRFSGDVGIIAERFPLACRKTTAPEYMDIMTAFFDVNTLADRLRDTDEISQEYRTITGNWHEGRFIVQQRDQEGNAVKVLYTILKINEKKEREREYETRLSMAAEEARRASSAKTDFLRRMSHDIRTPLNCIIGLLKIDESHMDDTRLLWENHRKIQSCADHLLLLINDILQMSKLEDGTSVLAHEVFDLRKMAPQIIEMISQKAAESGISIEYDKNVNKLKYPCVYGSPLHVRQIFLNIYSNCIKYNRENGKISTNFNCLGAENGVVTYQWVIADTGIGMSQEFLSHIFDPFAQERIDARSVYQGTGLGMSIVKRLIDGMGGDITVTSTLGVGSEFTITLPFEIADEAEIELPEADESATIDGLEILLAEDNDLNAEIAQTLLMDCGARVTRARDGIEAVEIFRNSPERRFDAILMDIMMPVADGFTATREIRAMSRADAGSVPIIAMTANAFDEDADECIACGMNAHLSKPFLMKDVINTISRLCRK